MGILSSKPNRILYMNNYNENNQRHGPWEDYWSNGQIFWKGDYLNGNKNGLFETYFDNGQLYWKGKYKNGEWHGLYESYYEDGQLESLEFYI